jgi:hypothetical protein
MPKNPVISVVRVGSIIHYSRSRVRVSHDALLPAHVCAAKRSIDSINTGRLHWTSITINRAEMRNVTTPSVVIDV